jgi:hypothetical protein
MLVVAGSGCADDRDGEGLGDECSEIADTCTGESVCVLGACEAAFTRVYAISNVQLAVPTTKPDNSSWDLGGGAPDLFLEISINGTVAATTPDVPDSFSATFAGPFDVQVIAGSTLLMASFDEDATVNDPAFNCQAAPLTAQQLRSRRLSCAAGGSSMQFVIEPK